MKFDLHVHSVHSSDALMEVGDIVNRITELGFGGFALTDHNSVEGNKEATKLARKAGLVFVPGIEVSTNEGHMLGLGIKKHIERDCSAKETVAEIHAQGGLAIPPHPYGIRLRRGIGDVLRDLDIDAIETVNGKNIIGNRKAKKVAIELGLPAVAGSDAHTVGEIGYVWTECGKDVLGEIRKGRTQAVGGVTFAALFSIVSRRMKGVPLFPKL